RTLEAIGFRAFAAEIKPQINGSTSGSGVFIKRDLYIGHVAAVGETNDGAKSHHFFRRLVPTHHEVHAGNEMDQKIAGDSGAVFLPATPARKPLRRHVRVPGAIGRAALPDVPIEILRGKSWRRRILPSAGGIVAAEPALDQCEFADSASGNHF